MIIIAGSQTIEVDGNRLIVDQEPYGEGNIICCDEGAVGPNLINVRGTAPEVGKVLVFFKQGSADISFMSSPIEQIQAI